ncbi:MAG: protein translocase subunit SecF [Porticoccaceae bacterium]
MSTIRIINFMRWNKLANIISLLMVVGSLISLGTKGLVMGLDFTGGAQVEVGYQQNAEPEVIRRQLIDAGLENPVVVNFGSARDVLIKFQVESAEGLEDLVVSTLTPNGEQIEVRRVEFIGPQVGEELRDEGGLAVLVAMIAIMIYVAVRFQYKFAVGVLVGLVHDTIITLGVFSLFQLDFDLTVFAGLMAMIGYSLNDTIVVYDRIRENFRLVRDASPLDIINESLTQVLVRTIYTSVSTLLVLFALLFLGGELIRNFSIALIVGIIVGTTSSIYVAANIILAMKISREDLMTTVKGDKQDEYELP